MEYLIWINSKDKVSGTNNDFTVDIQGLLPREITTWKIKLMKLLIPHKVVDIDLDSTTDSKLGVLPFSATGQLLLMCDLNSANVKNTSLPSNGSVLLVDNLKYYDTMNSILYYTGTLLTNFNARNSFFKSDLCYQNSYEGIEFITNNDILLVNFKLYNYSYITHTYLSLVNEDSTEINDITLCLKFTSL